MKVTLCCDTFEELKSTVDMKTDEDTQACLQKARVLLSRVQQLALSQIPDSLTRQLGGMLFSHASKVLEKDLLLNEPEIWEEVATSKRKPLAAWLMGGAALLLLLCFLTLWKEQNFIPAAALAAALLLLIGGIIALNKALPESKHKVVLKMDGEKLISLMGEQMRMIDRDLEALYSLLPQNPSTEVSDTALDAVMKVYEVQSRENRPHPEIMQAINRYLQINGIVKVEYTAHNAPLFQTLPTMGQTRTLMPALLKDEHLLRRGLAIEKKEEAQ